MKQSDFKHIVKESLRDAFYTKKVINEDVAARKITIRYYGKILPAIISKNTVQGEREYRVSVFDFSNNQMEAIGHFDLTEREAQEIIDNNKLPDEVYKTYPKVGIVNVNGWPEQKTEGIMMEPLKEELMTEELFGKKLYLMVHLSKIRAVLTKNTKPDEGEYRLTWFSHTMSPLGHSSFNEKCYKFILQNEDLPQEIKKNLSNKFFYPPEEITIQFVDGFEPNDNINENLLLLEDCSREVDLWLENKIPINESMNVVVVGADYKRTDRLDELVNYLQDTVVSPILRKMTEPDQIDYFHKNSVGFWNLLTPDGSYYSQTSGDPRVGTINLYPGGITSKYLRPILLGIFRQLKKLGVKWGTLKRERSGAYTISDVIRIPIISNNSKEYKGAPELNLSNINGYQIFHNLLQFEGESDFQMDAKELIERIEVLAHDKSWIDKNIIKPSDSDWSEAERDDSEEPVDNPHMGIMNQFGAGGARMIHGGLDADDLRFRLREIWKVARWAVDNGYKTISVG